MNIYIVLCQAFVFTILIIQNQFLKEVAAAREHPPGVANWFNSLEKKLNDVMHDVFQGARATAWEVQPDPIINTDDVIDKDNEETKTYDDLFNSRELQEHFMPQFKVNGENQLGERDLPQDILQDVRATAWEVQPESIKNTEDIIDKYNEEKNAYYDMFKSRKLQENVMPQNEMNGENIPGEREVSSVYLHAEYTTTTKPRPMRKKKIRRTKKKSHKLKPKRLGLGKSKKEMKAQEHLKKKQHPKRKKNNQARKNNIHEQKPNVSEHSVSSENKNRGKPVDIIVHIKMNE